MELVQQYGGAGVPLSVESDGPGLASVLTAHKERLTAAFAELTEDQWHSETRCKGWGAVELGHHVADAASFFAYTLARAQQGEATRLLEGFDPRNSPKERAAESADLGPTDVVADLGQSVSRLRTAFEALAGDERGDEVWDLPAEAPPGHVPARTSIQHCLFDSWLHERDLLVPLGLEQVSVPEEAIATTQYLCALAALSSLRDLDPFPEPGELLTVGLTDQAAVVEIALGIPTVVSLARNVDASNADVSAEAWFLSEAMSGRADLAEVLEPGTRPHTVLGGALPFLS